LFPQLLKQKENQEEIDIATLADIAVDPKMQGRGFAKELISSFELAAQKLGIVKLTLSVNSDNQNARHLYESCGWLIEEYKTSENSIRYVKYLS
jgi:ribosomal protein S18 acetylase RimI-like enzyme